MDILELLGHPVRLRIVHALRGGRMLTTAQLCARLPDVSKATVYRHVDLLTSGEVLEVAGEQRVRGAVERTYRLRQDRASIDQETAARLTPEDHRRGFPAAMAGLLAEFNAYLDSENADPAKDSVGYRQHAIWLDDDELNTLVTRMREAILPVLANEYTPDRARYLLSPILFPMADPD
ncbi:helix-turn-helix domain-containing protein [Nocardia arthritidis]|uniref:Helix-turn-helix domain-containing protein n=1 Tax=Nocardia arthritidis TaxID=228602 RepID=A0A6G9YCV9_9NOCA|nr:helix-turn-helix domain-containing protein [Nocardia arthritidis]QIS10970.1 helix-turn-helix domain-containing protein [Nocardia arthritidis]